MNYAELSRQLANIIRTGTIQHLDLQKARCRVAVGALVTDWLPFWATRAGTTRTWSAPTIGEQCVIFSPSGELAAGLVLAGGYSDDNEAPSASADEHLITFADGATIIYNHGSSTAHVSGVSKVYIDAAESIDINCPQTTIQGALTVLGLLTYQNGMVGEGGENEAARITGDVIANGVSLVNHTHGGIEPGGGNTQRPNAL